MGTGMETNMVQLAVFLGLTALVALATWWRYRRETKSADDAQDFFLVMTNAPGANAYPITATTFVLMHRQPKDKARSDAAIDFFRWALGKGQPQAQKLDYVPLPADLVSQIESYIGASIK